MQPGVFQVQSGEAVSAAELRRRYLELLGAQDKPFGYIIRALAGPGDAPGGGPGGPIILQGVMVTRYGDEQPVRGVRLGSVPAAAFRDLLDASRERTLYSARATGTDAVSLIVPNLIFEELEVQRTRDIVPTLPVVPPPVGD